MIEITLSKGKVAVINEQDLGIVSKMKWHAVYNNGNWYAVSTNKNEDGKTKTTQMHRLILGITDSEMQVDHVDGNGLNNTRCNLRKCTSAQNSMNRKKYKNNTSGFKGVTLERSTGKWRARIRVSWKLKSLGLFETADLAHDAYCDAARKLHGEFANFGTKSDQTKERSHATN